MTLCYSVDNVLSEKSYGQTCNKTLARRRNIIDNVCVNNVFSFLYVLHFEGGKIIM